MIPPTSPTPKKGAARFNYRPIMSLPRTWKKLTTKILEKIYNSLLSYEQFLEEQKGCHKGKRGTIDLLYINQYILKERNMRRKNVPNMVPQSLIIDCLKMCKISDKVLKFIEKNMKNWRVELTAVGKD